MNQAFKDCSDVKERYIRSYLGLKDEKFKNSVMLNMQYIFFLMWFVHFPNGTKIYFMSYTGPGGPCCHWSFEPFW